MSHGFMQKGFSYAELIISMAIIVLIFGIGTFAFMSARRHTGLTVLADSIVAELELAKSNSMAGLNGDTFGVNFGGSTGTTSYAYFEGSSYVSSDARNINNPVTIPYTLFATTTPAGGSVIFGRLNGTPTATATITVTDPNDPTRPQVITVGSLGDISISR